MLGTHPPRIANPGCCGCYAVIELACYQSTPEIQSSQRILLVEAKTKSDCCLTRAKCLTSSSRDGYGPNVRLEVIEGDPCRTSGLTSQSIAITKAVASLR
jgi:hypothetical protein